MDPIKVSLNLIFFLSKVVVMMWVFGMLACQWKWHEKWYLLI